MLTHSTYQCCCHNFNEVIALGQYVLDLLSGAVTQVDQEIHDLVTPLLASDVLKETEKVR